MDESSRTNEQLVPSGHNDGSGKTPESTEPPPRYDPPPPPDQRTHPQTTTPHSVPEVIQTLKHLRQGNTENTKTDKVLSTGQYGRVSLVKGEEVSPSTPSPAGWKHIISRIFTKKNPKPARSELSILNSLANGLLTKGVVDENTLAALPQGVSYYEKIKLANVFASISSLYNTRKFEQERAAQRQLPYDLGLLLSDFIEVMPRHLAAILLSAASDPDIAFSVARGQGTLDIKQADDVQASAIEAMVLLPRNVRQELFEEMAKIHPGPEGRAYKFFAFITANWANRMSDYNGPRLIERNLSPNEAHEKIAEVGSELPELGPYLRQKAG